MKPTDRIFVALDTTDIDRAVRLAESLRGYVGGMKIGKAFFSALGPEGVGKSPKRYAVVLGLKF